MLQTVPVARAAASSGSSAIEAVAEIERGEQVAGAVHRVVGHPAMGKAEAARRCDDQRLDRIGPCRLRGDDHLAWKGRAGAAGSEPVELEAVGRGDIGERQQRIADGLCHRLGLKKAAGVADDRVAEVDRVRVGRLDRSNQPGRRGDLVGMAEIADEHRADLAEPRRTGDVGEQGREGCGVRFDARSAAVAEMPGQHHSRHEDYRKAQPLQGEDVGAAADAAAGDQAVDDDDRRFAHGAAGSLEMPVVLIRQVGSGAKPAGGLVSVGG